MVSTSTKQVNFERTENLTSKTSNWCVQKKTLLQKFKILKLSQFDSDFGHENEISCSLLNSREVSLLK